MIDKQESRIGIFGASETSLIMSNKRSKTYQTFIKQKAGVIERQELDNKYIDAGNVLEHQIIRWLEKTYNLTIEKDKQIILEDECLRVNLDGNTDDCIFEIKTRNTHYGFGDTKPPKSYWQQIQVQMFASNIKQAKLVILYLYDDDYDNLLGYEIEEKNIKIFDIEYDQEFISEYLINLELAVKHMNNVLKTFESENNEEK